MMDQMSILKQNSPLWLESICTCMETWTMTASMKVSSTRYSNALLALSGKSNCEKQKFL